MSREEPGVSRDWPSLANLAAKVDGLQYMSSQWGSTLSMLLLAKMLAAPGWLLGHVTALQAAMRTRCLALLAAAEEHLGGVATWSVPQAGMFLWLTLAADYEPGPLLEGRTWQTRSGSRKQLYPSDHKGVLVSFAMGS